MDGARLHSCHSAPAGRRRLRNVVARTTPNEKPLPSVGVGRCHVPDQVLLFEQTEAIVPATWLGQNLGESVASGIRRGGCCARGVELTQVLLRGGACCRGDGHYIQERSEGENRSSVGTRLFLWALPKNTELTSHAQSPVCIAPLIISL